MDFNHFVAFAAVSYVKSLKRVKAVQNRKLETLKREYLATGIDPDKVIYN